MQHNSSNPRIFVSLSKKVFDKNGPPLCTHSYIAIDVQPIDEGSLHEKSVSFLTVDPKKAQSHGEEQNFEALSQFGGVKALAMILGTNIKGVTSGFLFLCPRKFLARMFLPCTPSLTLPIDVQPVNEGSLHEKPVLFLSVDPRRLNDMVRNNNFEALSQSGGVKALAMVLGTDIKGNISAFEDTTVIVLLACAILSLPLVSKSRDIGVDVDRDGQHQPSFNALVAIVAAVVTIMMVAIPEGLPLAVTLLWLIL
uniref:Uncharacterized protein n=1 Tax=Fagus sylvatica TaxID=28930 RepID=A0A2N9IHV1_FAGSY